MARVALLIGTEDYGSEFQKLEAIPRNIAALQKILENPQMGGFEDVLPLVNPNHGQMAEQVETWIKGRSKDDFLLLYIAGHGIKDMQRRLYFASSTSKKVGNELITTTALPAQSVHDWLLKSCKARRQVVILDCCFSGAYGDLIAQDDGDVHLEELAAEGRVVLTSSSSMEYSFQQREGQLSVYTHHLIEGIQTGAADLNRDGIICADDLHQYTSRKVREESPAMTPKIIVVKDAGYRLRISNAPLGNPEVQYRKEVELVAQQYGENITGLGRVKLDLLQKQLKLSEEDARSIEQTVLEPIRQRKLKLSEYSKIFAEAVANEYPFEEFQLKALSDIKKMLGLLDEDVGVIESEILAAAKLPEPKVVPVDLSRLDSLLSQQQWKEANDETLRLLLHMADRKRDGWILVSHIRGFSQEMLNAIDALWAEASQGRFGFGVQARLFAEKIYPLELPRNESWKKLDELLAWRADDANRYEFDIAAVEGHLPHWRKLIAGWGVSDRGYAFMERAKHCPIHDVELDAVEDLIVESETASQKVIVPEKYHKLEELLKAKRWQEADQETYRLMITTVGKKEGQWLDPDDLRNFPCEDLRTLDQLWVSNSGGKYGFSVQKRIWEECGSPTDYNDDWEKFGDRVGWRMNESWVGGFKKLDLDSSGVLPWRTLLVFVIDEGVVRTATVMRVGMYFSSLARRLVGCNPQEFQP